MTQKKGRVFFILNKLQQKEGEVGLLIQNVWKIKVVTLGPRDVDKRTPREKGLSPHPALHTAFLFIPKPSSLSWMIGFQCSHTSPHHLRF